MEKSKRKRKTTPKRKKTGKKMIVSDFDDTLFFTENSITFASMDILGVPMGLQKVRKLKKPVKSKVYEVAYTRYRDNLEPNTRLMERYRGMMREGYELVILSAKGEMHRKDVEYSLQLYGLKSEKILLQNDNWRTPDQKWKANEIGRHIENYEEVHFFEDKLENIESIREKIGNNGIRYFIVNRKGEKEV